MVSTVSTARIVRHDSGMSRNASVPFREPKAEPYQYILPASFRAYRKQGDDEAKQMVRRFCKLKEAAAGLPHLIRYADQKLAATQSEWYQRESAAQQINDELANFACLNQSPEAARLLYEKMDADEALKLALKNIRPDRSTKEMRSLTAEKEEIETKLQSRRESLGRLENTRSAEKKKKHPHKLRISELSKSIHAMRDRVAALQKTLSSLESAIVATQSTIDSNDTALAPVRQSVRDLASRLRDTGVSEQDETAIKPFLQQLSELYAQRDAIDASLQRATVPPYHTYDTGDVYFFGPHDSGQLQTLLEEVRDSLLEAEEEVRQGIADMGISGKYNRQEWRSAVFKPLQDERDFSEPQELDVQTWQIAFSGEDDTALPRHRFARDNVLKNAAQAAAEEAPSSAQTVSADTAQPASSANQDKGKQVQESQHDAGIAITTVKSASTQTAQTEITPDRTSAASAQHEASGLSTPDRTNTANQGKAPVVASNSADLTQASTSRPILNAPPAAVPAPVATATTVETESEEDSDDEVEESVQASSDADSSDETDSDDEQVIAAAGPANAAKTVSRPAATATTPVRPGPATAETAKAATLVDAESDDDSDDEVDESSDVDSSDAEDSDDEPAATDVNTRQLPRTGPVPGTAATARPAAAVAAAASEEEAEQDVDESADESANESSEVDSSGEEDSAEEEVIVKAEPATTAPSVPQPTAPAQAAVAPVRSAPAKAESATVATRTDTVSDNDPDTEAETETAKVSPQAGSSGLAASASDSRHGGQATVPADTEQPAPAVSLPAATKPGENLQPPAPQASGPAATTEAGRTPGNTPATASTRANQKQPDIPAPEALNAAPVIPGTNQPKPLHNLPRPISPASDQGDTQEYSSSYHYQAKDVDSKWQHWSKEHVERPFAPEVVEETDDDGPRHAMLLLSDQAFVEKTPPQQVQGYTLNAAQLRRLQQESTASGKAASTAAGEPANTGYGLNAEQLRKINKDSMPVRAAVPASDSQAKSAPPVDTATQAAPSKGYSFSADQLREMNKDRTPQRSATMPTARTTAAPEPGLPRRATVPQAAAARNQDSSGAQPAAAPPPAAKATAAPPLPKDSRNPYTWSGEWHYLPLAMAQQLTAAVLANRDWTTIVHRDMQYPGIEPKTYYLVKENLQRDLVFTLNKNSPFEPIKKTISKGDARFHVLEILPVVIPMPQPFFVPQQSQHMPLYDNPMSADYRGPRDDMAGHRPEPVKRPTVSIDMQDIYGTDDTGGHTARPSHTRDTVTPSEDQFWRERAKRTRNAPPTNKSQPSGSKVPSSRPVATAKNTERVDLSKPARIKASPIRLKDGVSIDLLGTDLINLARRQAHAVYRRYLENQRRGFFQTKTLEPTYPTNEGIIEAIQEITNKPEQFNFSRNTYPEAFASVARANEIIDDLKKKGFDLDMFIDLKEELTYLRIKNENNAEPPQFTKAFRTYAELRARQDIERDRKSRHAWREMDEAQRTAEIQSRSEAIVATNDDFKAFLKEKYRRVFNFDINADVFEQMLGRIQIALKDKIYGMASDTLKNGMAARHYSAEQKQALLYNLTLQNKQATEIDIGKVPAFKQIVDERVEEKLREQQQNSDNALTDQQIQVQRYNLRKAVLNNEIKDMHDRYLESSEFAELVLPVKAQFPGANWRALLGVAIPKLQKEA